MIQFLLLLFLSSQLFQKYHYKKVTLVRDIVTGFSKKYAFVEFKHRDDCRAARRDNHRLHFMGKQILVDYECERSLPGWIPRRLGMILFCSNNYII